LYLRNPIPAHARTCTDARGLLGSIANPAQYEQLRAKGYSKQSAARITNASAHKGKVAKMANNTSAFGVAHGEVHKADRRFSSEPNTKSGLYLPKHDETAGKFRRLAAVKKPLPPGAAIRTGLRVTTLGKSAFEVQH